MHTYIISFLIVSLLGNTADRISDIKSKQTLDLNHAFTFEKDSVNELPHGWKNISGEWKVTDDEENKVISQVAPKPKSYCNIAIIDTLQEKNIRISARMKFTGGKKERGGGIVWRYQDTKNYYLLWINPFNNCITEYRIKNGHRVELPIYGRTRLPDVPFKIALHKWYQIELQVIEDEYIFFIDGKELFRETDKAFTKEGYVGIWTKADAQTYFDNIEVQPLLFKVRTDNSE
ncbi:hypothetical protein GXP67_31810 [Rhodocytophaga rosea]|uniref:Glycosyl hydrolase family 59 C-terminal lectin domain-containing protein n=1 Tax=Rhodocytophaga rosea TaxID=2704465 RepID=A0A6C0GS63_9BACT|nr:DUF6250 domain-containing protein [Rhodocytophaga rosea]QHT70909.1 hypothetical protein GXP67_31810 [Rhodocytophaga rosea]